MGIKMKISTAQIVVIDDEDDAAFLGALNGIYWKCVHVIVMMVVVGQEVEIKVFAGSRFDLQKNQVNTPLIFFKS